jgi:O-acetyl-ADP-ribose deacetylase (regulator of RNase III)
MPGLKPGPSCGENGPAEIDMTSRLQVIQGNIVAQQVDAIVNAANEGMLGGGGVDGAIHRAAGPELLEACRSIPQVRPGVRCPTGEARITPAFRLAARFIIHTVGPVWRGGQHGEADLLASCYRNALSLAMANGCTSIAFPAISTGVYMFPQDAAARIAVTEAISILRSTPEFERILLVAYSLESHVILRDVVSGITGTA